MKVKLISITPDPEAIIAYIARVSNPDNQDNPDYNKLVKYLIRNKHWSPFEHSFMTVEITTSMSIGEQILRHRSFSFQKFSGRYSEFTEFEPVEIRKQATKNRQSSDEVFDPFVTPSLNGEIFDPVLTSELIAWHLDVSKQRYNELIKAGVAKEVARLILPGATQTTMYMSGSCRSWLTYLNLRLDEHTQKEHQLIAREVADLIKFYYPTVAEATNNFNDYKGMFI